MRGADILSYVKKHNTIDQVGDNASPAKLTKTRTTSNGHFVTEDPHNAIHSVEQLYDNSHKDY